MFLKILVLRILIKEVFMEFRTFKQQRSFGGGFRNYGRLETLIVLEL